MSDDINKIENYERTPPRKDAEQTWDEGSEKATWEYKGNANITTLEQALEFSRVDLDEWEVERHVFNTWTTTLKNGDGEAEQKWNIQVKVWFKRRQKLRDTFRDELLAQVRAISPPVKKKTRRRKKNGVLLEVDLFDPHFGKLAWQKETGESYDLKIATRRYNRAMDELMDKAAPYNVERILYIIGNDYFHYDNIRGETTAGTQQDLDGRWQKMWITGRRLAIQNVLRLSELAPVDVMIVHSNHDFENIFKLGDLLECYFDNNRNVRVFNAPTTRKYYRWGKCGIGFTHGNNEKPADLPRIMLREKQKEWSHVDFLEWHMGHFHRKKQLHYISAEELHGIVIRYLRSLSSTDAWHYSKGYVKNLKGAESFIWEKGSGLQGNYFVNFS